MRNTTKREIVEIAVITIAFLLAIAVAILTLPKKGDIIRYDCSISEISPDFPIEVKEQCRKLRADNILQKPK